MSYFTDTSDNLFRNTRSHLSNPVLFYEDPIAMPILVNYNEQDGEQARASSNQPYGPGYLTNLLNDNNQPFNMESPFSFPSLQRRPSEHRPLFDPGPVGALPPPSMDQPLPSTEEFTGMTTPTRQWFMPSAPPMAVIPAMAPATSMPFRGTMDPQAPITTSPPPVPLSTKPNMRKRTTTGMRPTTRMPSTTSGPGPAMTNVLDEHHPKPEGAYYPPTKRIKREPTENPRKPSWAISSQPEDASVISLARPPLAQPPQVNPHPAAEQTAASSWRKSSTYNSHSEVTPSAAAASAASSSPSQPPTMQNPPAPIIPTPLEPFPEAGTIMNFPLPQIDHQGQRPAAAERYFSSLEDDLLYQNREPIDIEMEYRAALRVRERVDWDCRRLGLRLRYLRRCQAKMAEGHRAARECEWQRGDFGEQG